MRYSLLLLFLLFAGCDRSAGPARVSLGHLVTSEDEIRGIVLAVDSANSDGRTRSVDVIHAPAGETIDQAAAQGTRLLALNKVHGLIGPARAGHAERVATVTQAESGSVLGLSGWTGSTPLPNLFGIGLAPSERGRALAVVARSLIGDKRGSVVIVRDPAAISANAAADRFAADCRPFANVTEVRVGGKVPSGDVVFFATTAAAALDLRSSVTAREYLFGDEEAEFPVLFAGADGFVIASPFDLSETSGPTAAFAKAYREKHQQPPTVAAALAHDAATIWSEAARRADSDDPATLHAELVRHDVAFATLSGPLTFAADHTARRRIYIARTKKGTAVVERTIEP